MVELLLGAGANTDLQDKVRDNGVHSKLSSVHPVKPGVLDNLLFTCLYACIILVHKYWYLSSSMYTQLPHTHTHHHVHTGWIISSYCCKPGGASQNCRETPSGWGNSRPAEQGGKLLLVVHLSLVVFHVQYSLCTKYHTTFRGI